MHLVLNLKTGGLEHLVLDMAAGTNGNGYKTMICCLENNIDPALCEKAQDSNIEIFTVKRSPKAVIRLIKLLKTKDIDILHTHNSVAHLFGCIAGRLAKVRFVIHTKHGSAVPYGNKFYGLPLRFLLGRLTDAFVCVSEDIFKHTAKHYRIDRNRLYRIINGVDLAKFVDSTRKPFQRNAFHANEKVICAVGRLSPEKSHETLLESFSMVNRDIKNTKLLIVGDGIQKSYLVNITKKLSIENSVVFMGTRTDVPEILWKTDIFILPSLTEGISLTLLEAMAAGKPIVATNVGGNPEVVVDGETGILVPPKDPQRMAEAIMTIIQNPELSKTMGMAGRKRVDEKFSLVRMVDEYKKLYEELLINEGINLKKQISLENAHMEQAVSSKPKILVFTNAFPRSFDPNKGLAVKEEIEQLRRYFDIKIISAIPRNIFSTENNNVPQNIWINDIEVFQPLYYTVPRIGIIFSGYSYYLAVKRMVEELHERFNFNLILSYWTYPDGLAASIYAKRFNAPFIIRPRGSDVNVFLNHGFLRKKLKTVFKRADKIMPKSTDLQESIKRIGMYSDKLCAIPNGINLKEFYPLDKEECRKKLDVPLDKKIVLFVGNLLPIKGVSCLLEAIKVLDARKRNDMVFQILGSGKLENNVREAIKKFKFVSAVLEGEIPHKDLPVWINASDLVCITSLNEGCPNILLESLACGIPVVATKVGGIPEIINSDMLGILVPKNDIHTIANAIEEALKRSWKKELLRERVSGSSWDRISEQLKDECLTLMERVKQ
jgi:sugar transferase (PEP-CTERM/EpsH1 system associated)